MDDKREAPDDVWDEINSDLDRYEKALTDSMVAAHDKEVSKDQTKEKDNASG